MSWHPCPIQLARRCQRPHNGRKIRVIELDLPSLESREFLRWDGWKSPRRRINALWQDRGEAPTWCSRLPLSSFVLLLCECLCVRERERESLPIMWKAGGRTRGSARVCLRACHTTRLVTVMIYLRRKTQRNANMSSSHFSGFTTQAPWEHFKRRPLVHHSHFLRRKFAKKKILICNDTIIGLGFFVYHSFIRTLGKLPKKTKTQNQTKKQTNKKITVALRVTWSQRHKYNPEVRASPLVGNMSRS